MLSSAYMGLSKYSALAKLPKRNSACCYRSAASGALSPSTACRLTNQGRRALLDWQVMQCKHPAEALVKLDWIQTAVA